MRYSDVDYIETWRALEACVVSKKVRSIGVSNFNHKQIERIIGDCSIKPAVLQVFLSFYKFISNIFLLLTALTNTD